MIEVKNLFVTEERHILNDTINQNMNKEQLMNDIALQYEMNGDEDYRELLKGLSDKISLLNEEEVNYLIGIVPLDVAYEVPEEEYI